MAQNFDNDNSVVLEGVYKSVESRIDATRQSLSKEMQSNTAQQISAYEMLADAFQQGINSVLNEIRFVTQQNSSIYEFDQAARNNLQSEILTAVKAKNDDTVRICSEKIAETEARLQERLEAIRIELLEAGRPTVREEITEVRTDVPVQDEELSRQLEQCRVTIGILQGKVDLLNKTIEEKDEQLRHQTEVVAEGEVAEPVVEQRSVAVSEEFDYDVLSEKIASIIPEIDYDVVADRVAALIPQVDADAVADKVVAALPQTDEGVLADRVVEAMPLVDYDVIAERVAALLKQESAETEEPVQPERIAEAVEEKLDYERIAERISAMFSGSTAEGAPEPIHSEHIAEAVEEKFDYDRIADRISAVLNVEGGEREIDPQQPDLIAEAVEEKLDYERIAQRVADLLSNMQIVVAAPVAPATHEEISAAQPEPVEEVYEEPVAVLAETEEEGDTMQVAFVPDPEPVVVVAPAPKKKVAEPVEDEQVVRLKYSFAAKIIVGDDEVKQFYSDIKNEFLSYSNTSSQINWANDRISYNNESIAKIGVRGKTLCMYLALNPDEFPESVYHQKFAGDTKMYEKTPMLVKIKSNVALKRALRLISLLMERNGAVKEEDAKPVDYASQYVFRSEEELIQEGLVKSVMIGKSESDFVRR